MWEGKSGGWKKNARDHFVVLFGVLGALGAVSGFVYVCTLLKTYKILI